MLYIQSWVLGLGPVCCSPALRRVPGCTQGGAQGAWGFHFTNHILRGARLGVQAGASPHSRVPPQHRGGMEEPGWEPGSRFHRCSWRKSSVPAGTELCSFSQTSSFSQSPGRRLLWPSPPFPAQEPPLPLLSAFLPRRCRWRGACPPLPRDPSAGKTHSPIPAGIFLCAGEQGDGESPWHRVSHPTAAPGLASSRGCSNSRGMFNPKQFRLQPHPGHKVSAMQKGFQAAAAPCTAPLPCLAAGMPCRTHGW